MISYRAMREGDFEKLNPHGSQAYLSPSPEYERYLMKGGRSLTFFRESDEQVIACAGGYEQWEGRRLIWAVMGVESGRYMRQMTRHAQYLLKAYYCRRSECYVDAQFEQGYRWATLIGFKLETPEPMRGFLPNGNDAFMFSMSGEEK